MRHHQEIVFVSFIDDGARQLGLQLGDRAVPVVDPDLDHPHFGGRELLHVAPCFGLGGDAVRRGLQHRRSWPLVGRRQPAAGRYVKRGVGHRRTVLDLVRQFAAIRAEALNGGDAGIRVPPQDVGEVVTRVVVLEIGEAFGVADVRVRIDERRHHRLAGQVDTPGPRSRANLPSPANRREAVAFDHERGIFHSGGPVADDQSGTFVESGTGRLRRQRGADRDDANDARGDDLDGTHHSSPLRRGF